LCVMVGPHAPKQGNARSPIGLRHRQRIHLIQHWWSDAGRGAAFSSRGIQEY
jgi:hypothetical protein